MAMLLKSVYQMFLFNYIYQLFCRLFLHHWKAAHIRPFEVSLAAGYEVEQSFNVECFGHCLQNSTTTRLTLFGLHVWCPERQVVPQQLHNQCRVFVGLLAQSIQLGDGVVECLLRQPACAVRRIEDLVIENGEVECQPKPNRVGWRQLCCGNVRSCFVRDQTVLGGLLAIVSSRKFSQVPVIIAFPGKPQNNFG